MTKLLTVYDNQQNLYVLQGLLEGHGYGVVSARDDTEVLEIARRNPAERFITRPTEPDAFVKILQEVFEELEAGLPVAPSEPVKEEEVFYREYYRPLIHKLEHKVAQLEKANRILERDIMESYRLGVNSYITKPVDFEQFTETVR